MSEGIRSIRLLGVPVALHARTAAHMDALQREFELVVRSDTGGDSVPDRLHRLIDELRSRYGGVSEQPNEELRRAAEAGRDQVDLTYQLPVSAGAAAQRLLDLLREADAYCREGDLLTLATPPEELAFREWFLGEVVHQAAGRAPTPWTPTVTHDATPADTTAPRPDDRQPIEGDDGTSFENGGAEGWEVEVRGRSATLRFCGELDLEVAPELRELVARVRQEGVDRVHLDLTEVTFLDSVGLSVLLSTHLRLDDEGIPMRVRPSLPVRRVMDLAAVTELLLE